MPSSRWMMRRGSMVACVGHAAAQNAILHVGGPEILSWDEAVAIFGQAVGRKVLPLHLPLAVARLNQALLSPLGDGPANIMGMIRMTGGSDSAYATTDANRLLDGPTTTMRGILDAEDEYARVHQFRAESYTRRIAGSFCQPFKTITPELERPGGCQSGSRAPALPSARAYQSPH